MKRVGKTLKKYFIPHPENDHKPHLLRPRTVAFVILVAVIVESAFILSASYIIPRSKLFGAVVVSALIDGTNAARTDARVPALTENALLDAAAQEKANDMVANDYFAHTSPAGVTPWYWFQNAGYNFAAAGENLAVNFSDSADVTSAWLNSPEHRANILNAGFTEIGMATAQGSYEGHPAIYIVELFGTPAPTFGLGPTANAATVPAPATSTKPVSKPGEPVKTRASALSTTTASGTANLVAVTGTTAVPATPIRNANLVQTAAANPVGTIDYFYLGIALLFAVALALNMFIKIRVQYKSLILGGMLVILVTGLFIVLNHHFALAGAVVL